MKRNPNPPRMFCSFLFFSHFHTLPLTNTHTEREGRGKRDVCAIALIANEGAAIHGGVGWGKRKGIHTHTRMAMDGCAALRCNGCTAMGTLQCTALQWNGMEMGRDFAVVSCLFLLLLFERARLIGAAAAIAGCWLSKFTIRMQCNGIELRRIELN